MALGVDLFGRAADGSIVWRWMCRFWSGRDVLELVAPPPFDPPPAWQGLITAQQIQALREKSGGRLKEDEFRDSQASFGVPLDPDLDELLARPVHDVIVHVEEWGYG